MNSLYSQFETDQSLEKDGVVIEYSGNIRFRIARSGGANQKYLKRLEAKTKPLRRLIQQDLLKNEEVEPILLDVFCETVILGWEGVTDRNGNPLEFTVENAKKLFKDLPELFNDLREQSQKSALFRKHMQEGEAKN